VNISVGQLLRGNNYFYLDLSAFKKAKKIVFNSYLIVAVHYLLIYLIQNLTACNGLTGEKSGCTDR